MTRTPKTPKQRAEEIKGRAERRLKRARQRLDKAEVDAKAAAVEWEAARIDYEYASKAPALTALRSDVTAQTGAGAVTTRVGKA